MKNSNFTLTFNFRKSFRRFKWKFQLTYQQFFFLWYIFENRFTDKFKVSDLLVPGCTVRNSYYYVNILVSKGYLTKKGVFYSLTETGKSKFAEFMKCFNRNCDAPFSWN
jgi:hypothetical protein